MSQPKEYSINPSDAELDDTERSTAPATGEADGGAGSPERLQRLAALVALGEIPLPRHLPTDQLRHLIGEVRRLRRRRLFQFLGRAIARDIEREAAQQPGRRRIDVET